MTTGTISSPGIGSGLDVKAIVDKLVAIEQRPIDVVAAQQKSVQTKVSSFGLLKNFMDNLKDAAAQLADPALWTTTSPTSSNADVATLVTTASTSAGTPSAAPGSYRLAVANLAQAQTLVSPPAADASTELGPGALRIELGAWNDDATAFTPKSGAAPATIPLPAGASSLEDIRDRLNAADTGVTATLLRDATGVRLVVKSSATGEENAVRITASGPGGEGDPAPAGLAALAYDPPDAVPGAPALTRAQPARDAHATINGVAVASATNVLAGAIEGATITLHKASSEPVDLGIVPDTTTMKKALTAFVGAYNDVSGYIAAQTKVDTVAATAAPLQGDSATMQLQKLLRDALSGTSTASAALPRLLDVGIHLGADNTLSLDSAKADKALANPQEAAKAFATDDALHPQAAGFGVRFVALATKVLGGQGLLATRTKALQDSVGRYQDRQSRMQDHVAQYQARLTKVYTALDAQLSTLGAQGSYIAQQVKLMEK